MRANGTVATRIKPRAGTMAMATLKGKGRQTSDSRLAAMVSSVWRTTRMRRVRMMRVSMIGWCFVALGPGAV